MTLHYSGTLPQGALGVTMLEQLRWKACERASNDVDFMGAKMNAGNSKEMNRKRIEQNIAYCWSLVERESIATWSRRFSDYDVVAEPVALKAVNEVKEGEFNPQTQSHHQTKKLEGDAAKGNISAIGRVNLMTRVEQISMGKRMSTIQNRGKAMAKELTSFKEFSTKLLLELLSTSIRSRDGFKTSPTRNFRKSPTTNPRYPRALT